VARKRKMTKAEMELFNLLRKHGTYLRVEPRGGNFYLQRSRKPLDKAVVMKLIKDGWLEESVAKPAYHVTAAMVRGWALTIGVTK
jgi:predicted transcriptional regulator